MDVKQLIDLNQRGLIPGPNEGEEAFNKRVATLPCVETALGRFESWDLHLDWVELIYSNEKLWVWDGGCALIDEKEGVRSVAIQLRKAFTKGHHLFYSKSEIVRHEAVHAARLCFDEPIFEEALAYRTSKWAYRRFLGPILGSRLLRSVALLSLVVIPLVPIIGLIGLACCFGTAGWIQWVLHRCLRQLNQITPRGEAMLLRLTDREIIRFAYSSGEEIAAFCGRQNSIRWRQINLSYLQRG